MNEFTKSVILMFFTAMLGAAISSFSTVFNIGADIAVLSNKVDTIVINQSKFDERIRKNELKRAYLAAN
ncbi:MAG: hypothetical protein ACJAXJ_002479 [Colwellia sp.]|jgi:hypothetical protein